MSGEMSERPARTAERVVYVLNIGGDYECGSDIVACSTETEAERWKAFLETLDSSGGDVRLSTIRLDPTIPEISRMERLYRAIVRKDDRGEITCFESWDSSVDSDRDLFFNIVVEEKYDLWRVNGIIAPSHVSAQKQARDAVAARIAAMEQEGGE